MDEENQNKQIGNKLKQGAKKLAKDASKKIIKKIIAVIVPILLKFLLIMAPIILFIIVLQNILEEFKSTESKEVVGGAIEYSYITYSGSETKEEENGYKIVPSLDVNAGGYRLEFKFYDENKKEISEETVLEDIKSKLNNENIDYSQLSDTNLKIIAVMEKNGLDLQKYNQEELKCLPMFIKAEIATQNFDIRDNSEEIDINDILDNDLIYGTIKVKRTKVINENGETKESETMLKYMQYEEFKVLEEQKKKDEIINYFTIDEEGNLIVAKWNTKTVNVDYLNENGNSISNEEIEKIPDENKVNDEFETSIICTPLEYKDKIKQYSLNFGVLSDLLITTQNSSFCADVCKLGFNSKIVIDLKEEKTVIDTTSKTTYNNYYLTCDYANYEIRGTHSVEGEEKRTGIIGGVGNPANSVELRNRYGWNSNINHTTNGNTITYTWEYNGNDYELEYVRERREENSTWILYEYNSQTSTESLPIYGNMDGSPEIIIGGQEDGFEKTNYTNKDEWTYIVRVNTKIESNSYKYELTEIDSWFAKFKKEYANPSIENTNSSTTPSTQEGTFEMTSNDVIQNQTAIEEIINNNSTVKAYVKEKEDIYKNRYQDAENVKCTIKKITEEKWEKHNETYESSTTTTKYKFGEEKADTTNITFKNIIYLDGVIEFDEESTDEGFLSVYDNYLKNGEDLYLRQDAEEKLFQLLEANETTRVYSDLFKGLLYSYDHIDRGITDLNSLVDVFNVKDFTTLKVRGSAIAEWLRSFEFNPLRLLRNGVITLEEFQAQPIQPTTVRVNDEGKMEYNMYELNLQNDHSINYSYGIMVYAKDQKSVYNADAFEGVDLNALVNQFLSTKEAWIDADIADRAQITIINNSKNEIREAYELKGVELEEHEIDALLAMSYAYGMDGAGIKYNSNIELVKQFKNGSISKEKLMENFEGSRGRPFYHNGRGEELRQMFFEGRYILSTGEEIDPKAYYNIGGGVTTQEEADALTEEFNKMLNTQVHSDQKVKGKAAPYQLGPYAKYWEAPFNILTPFQCTWWAFGRACMYLEENGTKYSLYPNGQHGDGGEYYSLNAKNGWFNYGSEPRVNSLCSKSGGDNGHVMYVEGVTDEGIWISDAGSGVTWRGVRFVSYTDSYYKAIDGFIYLDEPL